MKKQFNRFFARGNKTEVLPDDVLQIEKHMEHVRSACQSTCKKLSQSMLTHGAGDFEKRQKRLMEYTLSSTMQEVSKNLLNESESNQAFGAYLKICAEAQAGLAKERAAYELFVDENVISPLQSFADDKIPTLLKQRDRLKKLVVDKDIAEQNYQKVKAQGASGSGVPPAGTKIDGLKDEMIQAENRMELCKDQLISEMFEYLFHEVEQSKNFLKFHSKQLEYHRNCVQWLEDLEPQLDAVQDQTVNNRSFGRSLTEHLRASNRDIALPIEACVLYLIAYGLDEEGLLRLSGGAAKSRKTKAMLDGGKLDLGPQDDVHAVAGALKQYLRELPDPLLTFQLYDRWMEAGNIQDHDQKLQTIWTLIKELPQENSTNLRYLMKFLSLVAEHQDMNRMSPSNLAVVVAPNLLWPLTDDMKEKINASHVVGMIVECMISYPDYFFSGDIDFAVTPGATCYSRDTEPHNENLVQSVPVVVPMSPSAAPRNKSHSRNSSSDTNLSDTPGSSKPRKQKSKAPPPPPQQVHPVKTHNSESSKSSPPSTANEAKHPLVSKRSISKKPVIPPPNPPSDDAPVEETSIRPVPMVRKTASSAHPPIPPNKPVISRSNPAPKPHAESNGLESSEEFPPPPEDFLKRSSPEPPSSPQSPTGVIQMTQL